MDENRADAPQGPLAVPPPGDGLVLREWTEDDLPVMAELFDEPDVARRTPLASPFDLAAARAYLHRARRAQEEGRALHLAVTLDGGRALGEVLLNRRTGGIGYAVGAAHRGRGLAARAVRLVVAHALGVARLPRVVLEIEPDNHPSIAVARAAGFRLTDAPPETVTDKGRTYTLLTWVREAAGTG
ncbi:GNAT family N-acetyltransferase [Streptomyces sp. NPDC087420]|uniref:GNAT family N-acetyltransferase n=1 Tax=Streptomyces sp. NPDC087420 TaxID=3365785 RepID=UPI003837F559